MARIRISNVLRRIWAAVGQRSDQLRVQVIPSMQELPIRLGDQLYVVGHPGRFKWAILACPCGCDERIDVCLMPSARPRWELTLRDGRPLVSLDLGASGEMRQSLLDSSEPNRLV